ncbi:MAG: nitrate reductase [Treponema sp.]|nr:nitrate reductase [Treponema sp.]
MKRIMIDQEKCDGCKNCSIACMQAHLETKGTVYSVDLLDVKNEARHAIVSNGRGGYVPVFCRHCAVPECVSACMSGALKKEAATGHVQYDEKRCGVCFMCVISCPYGNVRPDRASRTKALKCDFCKNDNEDPNCVKSCPKKAICVEEVDAGGIAV